MIGSGAEPVDAPCRAVARPPLIPGAPSRKGPSVHQKTRHPARLAAALTAAVLAGGSTLAAAAAPRATAPSNRFDFVRFATVAHGPRAIVATLGIGVDI